MSALTKIFGTHSDRELKRITPLVDKVESYRDEMKALSHEELRGKTKEYKERLEKGETLDDLLPEAYATVREAASRVLGMEHYRVQIIGGIILHQGRIAEMRIFCRADKRRIWLGQQHGRAQPRHDPCSCASSDRGSALPENGTGADGLYSWCECNRL